MDYYDNPYISIIKRNANPELLWFASCILLIVAMAVIAKIITWQLCRRFLSATPRYFTKKKSTWQVLNIYFHPVNAKFTTWRQILNRTMFFFLQISWRWSPALMSRSSTSLLWRERRLSSRVPSTPWGTLRSVKYTATCKIVIYIASSAEWNVKVAYLTFSFNFNDLNNCTISSKLKFKRSLLYIPHWFDTLSKIFQHCSRF